MNSETESDNTVGEYVQQAYVQNANEYLSYRTTSESDHPENMFQENVSQALQGIRCGAVEVLDLGCGFGGGLPNDILFNSYVGVDISDRLLKEHRWRVRPEARLLEMDLRNFKVPIDVRYNLVLAVLTLNYIRDIRKLLDEIRRPYAWFFIGMPNADFDVKHGSNNTDNIVELSFNDRNFFYYRHELNDVIEALQPVFELKLSYSSIYREYEEPPYYQIFGQWR